MELKSLKICLIFSFLCGLFLVFFYNWEKGGYITTFFHLTGNRSLISWIKSSNSSTVQRSNSTRVQSNNTTQSIRNLTILLWYWPFGQSSVLKGNPCRFPHCKLVDNRSFFPSANIVIFHNRELINGRERPPTELQRPPGQRWVWFSLESPAHNGHLQKFANIFNTTMSYRRDADIVTPYARIVPRDPGEKVEKDSQEHKDTLACWVVSNFQNHHRRTKVYRELKKIIPIKVYGRATGNPLSDEQLLPTVSRCYFYLAFENSEAKDYITEKLWRTLSAGTVPVVLGPPIDDYKAVAPNHSFIHVDEFASLKNLGNFLQELSKDKKRYNEYFEWKKQWKVRHNNGWEELFCKCCQTFDHLPEHKVYLDLEKWDKTGYIIS